MRLNFADTDEPKEGGFPLLPNGKYHCQITGSEMTETGENSQTPGVPMTKLELTILSGKYENRRLWDNLVLGDSSLWKTKLFLYALGWTKEEVADPAFEFDPADEDEGTGLPGDRRSIIEMELVAVVGRQAAKDGYEARNRINRYEAYVVREEDVVGESPGSY